MSDDIKDTPTFSSYSVNDVPAALAFYRDVLGLDASETKEGLSIKLKTGNVFLYPKEDHTPATFTVLNFEVEDIEAAVTELKTKGVLLEEYDNETMQADEMGVYRGKKTGNGPDIAWFKDPANNILSVIEG